jgi:hypothetical protein
MTLELAIVEHRAAGCGHPYLRHARVGERGSVNGESAAETRRNFEACTLPDARSLPGIGSQVSRNTEPTGLVP